MHRLSGLLLVAVLALAPASGRAQSAEEGLAALASPSFENIRRGVDLLALSGHPRATSIIAALQAGRLYVRADHVLFIKTDDGAFAEAATGQPAPDVMASGLKPVRMNNPVRGAVEAALGSLRLFAPDPATRLDAAEAVFHSHDPAALPALDRAIAKETDAGVKLRMEQAHAAATLFSDDAKEADRLAAVEVIRARGDLDSRWLLDGLSGQPASVVTAADAAKVAIDRVLQLWSILQSVYYGLSLGSVLLLAAAGLAITFGVMGVINMAHGEMVMIGAYTTFMVQQVTRASVPGLFGASLLISVPLAFIVAGVIGILIERTLIRWLYGRPLETLLATWGLSLTLQQAVRSIFGANNRDVSTPDWMSGATQVAGLTITFNRLYIIIFAFLVLAALMAALRFTSLGLRMRAVTQNRQMAAAMMTRGFPISLVAPMTAL